MAKNLSTGTTESVWMATSKQPQYGPLLDDARADVCIVGAGIAGITNAYLLANEGRKVIVLDKGTLASGESGRTTAHLTYALDDRFIVLEKLHGARGAQLAAASHKAAVDEIERIVGAEKIDCDFRRLDGYLWCPPEDKLDLEKEYQAAREAGLANVEMVDRAPLPDFDTGRALRFTNQGQFHPLKYLKALVKAIEEAGGKVCGSTHVRSVEDGTPCHVKTATGATVTADAAVVATCTPINDRVMIHTKQAAYRTYVIGAQIKKGSIPTALYWDTIDPYHYVRLQSGDGQASEDDILIVGGEDHKTGQAEDEIARFGRLEKWTRERFKVGDVVYRWSGQVIEPIDGLAFIGRNPHEENVYIATSDSGQGMTHGTIAGMLISDLIQGRSNPWETLYDPSRKTLRAAKEFLAENLNVAKEYGHWVTPGDVKSADEIPSGEGATMRHGMSKVAVYRDPSGKLHSYSAVCTHLGCIVEWNHAEKSWDCPCHGSRWSATGKILNGPAISNLEHEPLE